MDGDNNGRMTRSKKKLIDATVLEILALMNARRVRGSDGQPLTAQTLVREIGAMLAAIELLQTDNRDLLTTVRVLKRL